MATYGINMPKKPGKPPLMVDPIPGRPIKPRPPKPHGDPRLTLRNGGGITGPGGKSVDKMYNTY